MRYSAQRRQNELTLPVAVIVNEWSAEARTSVPLMVELMVFVTGRDSLEINLAFFANAKSLTT
jgi:hypothetical protein